MSHKAVSIGSSIYYIGGTYAETVTSFREAPMNSITIYDTDKAQWSTQATSGPVPTTRIRHTATSGTFCFCNLYFTICLMLIKKKRAKH